MGTIAQKLQKAIDSKEAIKAALIAKGVENVDDVMSHYAGFIEAIQSGGGGDFDLGKLGYTADNSDISDAIAYAEEIKKNWNPTGGNVFMYDKRLKIMPDVDFSQRTNFHNLFYRSNLQIIPKVNALNATDCESIFKESLVCLVDLNIPNCTNLRYAFQSCGIVEIYFHNTEKVEYMDYLLANSPNLNKVVDLSFKSIGKPIPQFITQSNKLEYAIFKDIGYQPSLTNLDLWLVFHWGGSGEINRQTLVDSLVTYSFDRAKAGYPTCTLRLHKEVTDRLTEDEKAAITTKGFTITN